MFFSRISRKPLLALTIFNFFYFFYVFEFNSIVPVALDNALVLSGKVFYSHQAAFELYYRNSFNFPTQLAQFMLLVELPIRFISVVLLFIPVIVLNFVCFYIARLFVKDAEATLIAPLYGFFGVIHFPSPDYPVLLWHWATFGLWGSIFALIPVCFLIYQKTFLSVFSSVLLLLVHPIIGAYVLVFICIYLVCKGDFFTRQVLFGLGWSLAICTVFLIKYLFYDRIEYNSIVDFPALEVYREFWQTHRWSYVSWPKMLLYLLATFLVYWFLKYGEHFSELANNSLRVILTLTIFSMLLYSFKPVYPSAFMDLMPGRFLSVVAPVLPLFLGLLMFDLLRKMRGVRFLFFLAVGVVLFILSRTYPMVFFSPNSHLVELRSYFVGQPYANVLSSKDFVSFPVNEIIDFDRGGSIFVAAPSVSRYVMYRYKLAPILDPEAIDVVNYYPALAHDFKEIVSKVYGIDFNSPPRRNSGNLRDHDVKVIFVSRGSEEWLSLSSIFKFCYVAVPSTWSIDADFIKTDGRVSLYSVCGR